MRSRRLGLAASAWLVVVPAFAHGEAASNVAIDQVASRGADSLVVEGDRRSTEVAAAQVGQADSAWIRLQGDGHVLQLVQTGTGDHADVTQTGAGQTADVLQGGSADTAVVVQSGRLNVATIRQGGSGAWALVSQAGVGNLATVFQGGAARP